MPLEPHLRNGVKKVKISIMAVKIRLQRMGKKDFSFFRIVVTDKTFKRNGRVRKILGYINPVKKPALVFLDKKELNRWITQGAIVSPAVTKMIRD